MGQILLQIRGLLQGGGKGASSDERGPIAAGYNLAAHHFWSMEAHQLHALSLGPLYSNHNNYPLRTASIHGDLWQTHHVVSQPVMEICLAGDLGIGQ